MESRFIKFTIGAKQVGQMVVPSPVTPLKFVVLPESKVKVIRQPDFTAIARRATMSAADLAAKMQGESVRILEDVPVGVSVVVAERIVVEPSQFTVDVLFNDSLVPVTCLVYLATL